MSSSQGITGTGNRYYRDDPDLLSGVLASEYEHSPVYPDDTCLECEREGKPGADETCYHRHWRVADAGDYERRTGR